MPRSPVGQDDLGRARAGGLWESRPRGSGCGVWRLPRSGPLSPVSLPSPVRVCSGGGCAVPVRACSGGSRAVPILHPWPDKPHHHGWNSCSVLSISHTSGARGSDSRKARGPSPVRRLLLVFDQVLAQYLGAQALEPSRVAPKPLPAT